MPVLVPRATRLVGAAAKTGFRSLVLAAVLLVAAPSAQAATVSGEVISYCGGSVLCDKYQLGEPATVYRFATEPGERSTATVERTAAVLRFRDESAPVKAGARCRQVDDRTAECDTAANPAPVSVSMTGGAGDDVLTAATPLSLGTTLDGGAGADELRGGSGAETLVGGAGADRLSGGGGDDVLFGDDRSASASLPLGGDTIDGGEGNDLVSYADHNMAVDVDLAGSGPDDGAVGEGDSLTNVERLEGGGGDDTLRGDEGANSLLGGDGDDTLDSRGGDDHLEGGAGKDAFEAGAGDDRLEPVDLEADDLRCGSGADTITEIIAIGDYEDDVSSYGPDAVDLVRPDCELALVEDDDQGGRILRVKTATVRLRRGRALDLPNPCRHKSRCRVTVTVRARAGTREKNTRRTRSAATVSVRLTGRIRSAARRGRVAIAMRITRGNITWTSHFTAPLAEQP